MTSTDQPQSIHTISVNDHPHLIAVKLILSEVIGTPLHRLARDSTMKIDESVLESALAKALRALFIGDAEYWDQRLENFIFCDEKESGQGKVVVVDLEQVTFPDQSSPWEKIADTWETSMNFGTACSLVWIFHDIRHWSPPDLSG